MSFQIKKFDSIVASMLNWLSSTTDKITDFNVGSVSRTILESVAIELEELYYQLLKAVEEAIEESIYRTFNFPKNPAERATGLVTFTRLVGAETTVAIPLGTLVSTDSSPAIYFETLAQATMPVVPGTAEDGSTTTLIDSSVNFVTLGIIAGSTIKNTTAGGEGTVQVTTITGTATGGAATKLIDISKNFNDLGVIATSIVTDLTDGTILSVVGVSTTTNPYDTLDFVGGSTFVAGHLYTVTIPFVSSSGYGTNDTLHFSALTNAASFSVDIAKLFYSPLVRGAASGGSATTLVDITKNFTALGVIVGSTVTNLTDGGTPLPVTTITTTNPAPALNDTLNFAAGGSTFGVGDYYEVDNVYYPTDYTLAAQYLDDIFFPVGLQIGDYLYIGFNALSSLVNFEIGSGVAQTVSGILSGEYWTGSLWNTLSYFDDLTKGVNIPFSVDGAISWEIPSDWARSVYQTFNYYWIRIKSDTNLRWLPTFQGTATGGSATTLVDATKDFTALGVVAGSIVTNVTDGGTLTVTSVSPVTTIHFASGSTFGVTDVYRVDTVSQGDVLRIAAKDYKVIVMTSVVSCQAVDPGIDGNVAANSVTVLKTAVASINSVNNAAAFSSGREIETDSARKARFAYYIQSLARATKGALEYAAKTVSQVVAARAIDDNRPTVLRYDSSAAAYTDITTQMRNPGDAAVRLFPTAEDEDDCLYIGGTEIFDYLNMRMVQVATVVPAKVFKWEYWDGVISGGSWQDLPALVDGTALVAGEPLTQSGTVSWTMSSSVNNWTAAYPTPTGAIGTDPADKLRLWIRLRIDSTGPVFTPPKPTGDYCSLPPGLGYVFLYCHDGSGTLPTAVKTSVESAVELYRGCGITVLVMAPYVINPTIVVTVTIAANYDITEMGVTIKQYLMDWLSTKILGEDLFVAEVYHKVMGMNEKAIKNCDVVLPSRDIIVPASSVIVPSTALITVNTVLE